MRNLLLTLRAIARSSLWSDTTACNSTHIAWSNAGRNELLNSAQANWQFAKD